VAFEDRLIHLDETGRIRAWALDDGAFDAELSTKLSSAGEGIFHLASETGKVWEARKPNKLWAAGKSTLYSWSSWPAPPNLVQP